MAKKPPLIFHYICPITFEGKQPRDHGQAWWFPEYDAELGEPLGKYYKKDDGYYREFENGIVVCSPVSDIIVIFDEEYTDITTNIKSTSFTIAKGDGRIFIK